jgi:hypothetical protein
MSASPISLPTASATPSRAVNFGGLRHRGFAVPRSMRSTALRGYELHGELASAVAEGEGQQLCDYFLGTTE